MDKHGFNLWADGYDKYVIVADENNRYPFAGYRKLINAVYGEVMAQSPATVLDIGIGTGTLSAKLYEAGNAITGLDFSVEMLNIARNRMPDARLIQSDFPRDCQMN